MIIIKSSDFTGKNPDEIIKITYDVKEIGVHGIFVNTQEVRISLEELCQEINKLHQCSFVNRLSMLGLKKCTNIESLVKIYKDTKERYPNVLSDIEEIKDQEILTCNIHRISSLLPERFKEFREFLIKNFINTYKEYFSSYISAFKGRNLLKLIHKFESELLDEYSAIVNFIKTRENFLRKGILDECKIRFREIMLICSRYRLLLSYNLHENVLEQNKELLVGPTILPSRVIESLQDEVRFEPKRKKMEVFPHQLPSSRSSSSLSPSSSPPPLLLLSSLLPSSSPSPSSSPPPLLPFPVLKINK